MHIIQMLMKCLAGITPCNTEGVTIFGFHLFGVCPSILQLQCHLPNMQYVIIEETANLKDVVKKPSATMTTLTEYFTLNRADSYARKFLYREIPEHYRWISGKKAWQRRKAEGTGGAYCVCTPG